MKWTGIFIGVALIISITVISCFMIYADQYKCMNIVGALFFLLIVYLFFLPGYWIVVKVLKKTIEKCLRQQEYKHPFVSFESEIMKKMLILEIKIKEMETEMQKIKNSIF